ncbi:hypothetical protein ABI59_04625 [Acidobacteria bacterium Mor1]|nr:hypothetical protein ABI59_04625 [Acidobacteria bacterium Mor1]
MSGDRHGSAGTWRRVALLVGLPLLLWGSAQVRAVIARGQETPTRSELARPLSAAFEDLLEEARSVAEAALDGATWDAASDARLERLEGTVEGIGLFDPDGNPVEWWRTPVDPAPAFLAPAPPTWIIRQDGIRTRLIACVGPNKLGLRALASFAIDSRAADLNFLELADPALDPRAIVDVEFLDTRALYGAGLADPAVRERDGRRLAAELESGDPPRVLLRSDEGVILGRAEIQAITPERRASDLERSGRAWAALLLAVLPLLLFRWSHICRSPAGFLAALVTLVLVRQALLATKASIRLFPREMGSSSLFGSADFGRLLGSPLDLLWTALTIYFAALALRVFAGSLARSWKRSAALLVTVGAALSTGALYGVTRSLAVDARVPLLELGNLARYDGPALLLLGWSFVLLGSAELWGAAWSLLRGGDIPAAVRPHRVVVAVAILPLAILGIAQLHSLDQQLAIERLRSEFAPQVLGQTDHRRVTLISAVRQVADALSSHERPRGRSRDSRFQAYELWLQSDLYQVGYKSSLDLHNIGGDRVSHFGFDLPAFDKETRPDPATMPLSPELHREDLGKGAQQQLVLHAEAPVIRDGHAVGAVVGHILDAPSNLPFIPTSQPYLAALGSGRGAGVERQAWSSPAYVLYDRRGTVLYRTVDQPPTLTRELEMAAARDGTVRVRAAEESYIGLPLLDGDSLHLLMLRARTPIEWLGALIRLVLVSLGLLTLLFLLANLFRRDGPQELSRAIRGSFYRKLAATLLLAAGVPLLGLSLFVRGYIESRGLAALGESAVQSASVAQRAVEDYLAGTREPIGDDDDGDGFDDGSLDDDILYGLRWLVEADIHVYRDGRLEASSKRELFDSGLLTRRLPGDVQDQMVRQGLPYLVLNQPLGSAEMQVAYAPVRAPWIQGSLVVAVPRVLEEQTVSRDVDRVLEVLLLVTVAMIGLVILSAAVLARSVARPVRDLVGATSSIAAGDYRTRLSTRSQDEVADLVDGFNTMASALAAQRADLEYRRDYMETLLGHATTGVVSTDAEGRIVTINPALTALLGLGTEQLVPGQHLTRTLGREEVLGPLVEALERPSRGDEPRDVDLPAADGQTRRLRVMQVELPDPRGAATGSLLMMDDVTELMRSNQLTAWAEMARAIAHEIKNPLTPIQLSTEHLQRILRDRGVLPAPQLESCIDTVFKQVRALREIAGEFSTYAKLPVLVPESADAVAFMREVVGPYRASHPQGVEIEEHYSEVPPVRIDRRVLGRAVINLIENALQAMPDGGTLTVSVDRDAAAREVRLSVEDTGTGLDPEVRKRLFEPYFSTKSSGTGLGLAIVQRSVEAHAGSIEVSSRPGHGTRFVISLPGANSPAS